MELIDLIQRNIEYIEVNLKVELSLEELAANAGFSVYHYCRVFGTYLGMPVAAYITTRRLQFIIYEAGKDKRLVEAALEYGFETYAGFYKAFVREYGCSPRKYIKLVSDKKPVRIDLKQEARIMLTHTQIKQILSNWDIDIKPAIDETEVLTANGLTKSDKAWYIGENYVLKTYKSYGRLKTHMELSLALADSDVSVGGLIRARNGLYFLQKDDSFYVLMTRIKGSFLTPEERYSGNRSLKGKKYGAAIGRLHAALKSFDKELEVYDTNLYKLVMEWAMPETRRIMEQWACPLPEEFYDAYANNFAKLYEKLPRQIIHRDPNPSNILWDNDEVASFIDFEISERNVRLFDPCYCATGILSEAQEVPGAYDKWKELLAGIITGYDDVCSLIPEEKEAIPYIIYSIQMIFLAWLNSNSKDKRLSETNRNMLVWLWVNREQWEVLFK